MSEEIEEKLTTLDLTSKTEPEKEIEKKQSQNNRKSLDDLIEEYLIELDRYSITQKAAGDEFSKGYLDLAKANTSAMIRPLGKSFYDERVTESTPLTIKINNASNDEEETLEIHEDSKGAASKQLALGLNAPMSVKTAQLHFKTGLKEIIHANNIKIRVEKLADQIEKLKRENEPGKDTETPIDNKEKIQPASSPDQIASDTLKDSEVLKTTTAKTPVDHALP